MGSIIAITSLFLLVKLKCRMKENRRDSCSTGQSSGYPLKQAESKESKKNQLELLNMSPFLSPSLDTLGEPGVGELTSFRLPIDIGVRLTGR